MEIVGGLATETTQFNWRRPDPMRNYVVTSFLTLRKKAFIPLLDHNQKKFVVQMDAHWMKEARSRKKYKKVFL